MSKLGGKNKNKRLQEFIDIINSIADSNYSRQALVFNANSREENIAKSINTTLKKLNETTYENFAKLILTKIKNNILSCEIAGMSSIINEKDEIIFTADNDDSVLEINKDALSIKSFISSKFLTNKNYIVVNDLQKENTRPLSNILIKKGIKSFGIYPLFVKKELMGTVIFGSKQRDFFGEKTNGIVSEFADNFALAIKHIGLNQRERQFGSILETLNEAILRIDKNDKIIYANRQAHEILASGKADILGVTFKELIFPKDETALSGFAVIINLDKERKEGKSGQMELNIKNNKGENRWFLISGSVLQDELKAHSDVIAVISDITSIKNSERDKRKAIIATEEKERQQLAYDLHDGLGQTIAAANMYINAIENAAKKNIDPKTYIYYENGKKLLNKAVSETTLISHNIMPRSLEIFGLEQTLHELIDNIEQLHDHLDINLGITLEGKKLGSELELAIYRAIHEIIDNTIKHSKADQLNIKFTVKDTLIFIETQDNGIGFELSDIQMAKKGIGLKGLGHKIETIGGILNVYSRKGKGTVITIQIKI